MIAWKVILKELTDLLVLVGLIIVGTIILFCF